MTAVVSTSQVDSGNGLYLCTGTTWTEIQDLDSAAGYSFQGSNFGYASGGWNPLIPGATNVIDKFPFASDANASDVGDLTVARRHAAGQSSSENGYTSGGGTPQGSNVIDKFPFASDGNATDVGDLTGTRAQIAGQSSSENGYTSGGTGSAPTPIKNEIEKFLFASDGNATDVGDITSARYGVAGQSSTDNGYTSGGTIASFPSSQMRDIIDKFPFASDANASDVGDLTLARANVSGQSSTDNGYTSGGDRGPSSYQNIIDKFPFASDANATDVGDLSLARSYVTGQSSTVSGYSSGGLTPAVSNVIDKFPFASDANATDVGDLTLEKFGIAGQQY